MRPGPPARHVTRNKRNTRRRLTGLALAAIVGLAVLSRAGSALVIERPVGQPDAIIMLASHESERLPAAGALARQHPTSVVLSTVPKDINQSNCERCTIRTEWLGPGGGGPRARPHAAGPHLQNTG